MLKYLDKNIFRQIVDHLLPSSSGMIKSSLIINELKMYLLFKEKMFLCTGNLLALSSSAKCDLEDCFSFNSEEGLQLAVQTETYQTLGLEGKASSDKTSNVHGM